MTIDNVYENRIINIYENVEFLEIIDTLRSELRPGLRRIFDLLMQGYKAQQISKKLNLTNHSVRSESYCLKQKTKVLYKELKKEEFYGK